MYTIIVEYQDNKALSILEELEKFNIIKLIKEKQTKSKTIKLSEKYKGVWTKEVANDFELYTKKSREEW